VLCVCAWQAEKSWSKERCCEVAENTCDPNQCFDFTASSDYLYRLSPGDPERYEPIDRPTNYQSFVYQMAGPTRWPSFGQGELTIGNSGPPGNRGYCDQGTTYSGSTSRYHYNAACGGTRNWDHTDLEVWKRA
jgi:hypothetical protein